MGGSEKRGYAAHERIILDCSFSGLGGEERIQKRIQKVVLWPWHPANAFSFSFFALGLAGIGKEFAQSEAHAVVSGDAFTKWFKVEQ